MLDRLLHHAHVITLKGESYWMRSRLAPPKANSSPPDGPAAPALRAGGRGREGPPRPGHDWCARQDSNPRPWA
ncbi:ATP-binding protein [Geochorda subterranea]|uniref:ATP-binding protein n=1 Tax=Geochorda subterranea TaxID=3109564 RepID=UPI0038602B90